MGYKRNWEELPLVQGKEQWLRFARAAIKRYPMSKVRVKLSLIDRGIQKN